MESGDIERLFLSVLENSGQDTDAARQVFSILIRTTLEYRDRVLASQGVVVTVADVRKSLDWLVPALAAGNVPVDDNEISLGLLNIWLRELKSIT